MGLPAAKLGDKVFAVDIHVVVTTDVPATLTTPLSHPFNGLIDGQLSRNVRIMGRAAATVGSTATSVPPHIAAGIRFVTPPTNRATILGGSVKVRINGKPAARAGDAAMTCNDPGDLPIGHVLAVGSVNIG
jgi:uncharacterized Zn-binding protein involved in type VI secretion